MSILTAHLSSLLLMLFSGYNISLSLGLELMEAQWLNNFVQELPLGLQDLVAEVREHELLCSKSMRGGGDVMCAPRK